MRFSTILASSTALALVMTAQGALADLSAEDVWGNWQRYLQGYGYEAVGTQSRSGDTLTLSDIVMRMNVGDGEMQSELQIERLQFVENGDGTVSVVMPEEMPLRFVSQVEGMDPFALTMVYRTKGLEMVASGTPEDVVYTYSANELAIDLGQINVGEIDIEEDVDFSFEVVMEALSGTSRLVQGDAALTSTEKMTVARVSYDMSVQEGGSSDIGQISGVFETVTLSVESELPEALNFADLSQFLGEGIAGNAVLDYARGRTSFEFNDPTDGNFTGTTASEGGRFEFAMGAEGLVYDISARDLDLEVFADALPFGISSQMGEAGFNLTMPVVPSDEEQGFAMGLNLTQLKVNDGIWNMIDPGAALPRDPADLDLDLSGKAKVFADLFDAEGTADRAMRGEAMGELNALTLNNLLVAIAGAKLTGAGDFTFDNTVDFNGMPKPEGAVDLQLEGGNGLLDKLVAMGLLPEEQAMGARMMMGLFAVPGEGEDVLNSTIEINEAGHILANGQRIQ